LEYVNQHIKLTHETLLGYRKQFSLGRRSLLDLLNTENEYISAMRTLITNEADQLNAKYRILATCLTSWALSTASSKRKKNIPTNSPTTS